MTDQEREIAAAAADRYPPGAGNWWAMIGDDPVSLTTIDTSGIPPGALP